MILFGALGVLSSLMIVSITVSVIVYKKKRRSLYTMQQSQVGEQQNSQDVNLIIINPTFPQILS